MKNQQDEQPIVIVDSHRRPWYSVLELQFLGVLHIIVANKIILIIF
jgi:hypothetical protein